MLNGASRMHPSFSNNCCPMYLHQNDNFSSHGRCSPSSGEAVACFLNLFTEADRNSVGMPPSFSATSNCFPSSAVIAPIEEPPPSYSSVVRQDRQQGQQSPTPMQQQSQPQIDSISLNSNRMNVGDHQEGTATVVMISSATTEQNGARESRGSSQSPNRGC